MFDTGQHIPTIELEGTACNEELTKDVSQFGYSDPNASLGNTEQVAYGDNTTGQYSSANIGYE